MDFTISEEAKMIQAVTKKFSDEECLPVEREMMVKQPDYIILPPEHFDRLRNKLKQIGLWALDVPKEFGGQEMEAVTCCLIAEEQNKTIVGSSRYPPYWIRGVFINPGLYRGSDYQKQNYLYPLINGEKRSALALTEPDAGSDAAAIKTRAVRKNGGWVINGTKRFITEGDTADVLYVVALTDPAGGRKSVSIFLVDKGTPGLKVERQLHTMRPEYSAELAFDDCFVPDKQRLEGNGWELLQEDLFRARTIFAQGCVGMSQRALSIAIDYTQQRSTFGELLSKRQAIQWMLVDSAINVHLTKLLALESAWKVDQKQDVKQETAMLKMFATEMAFQVLDKCIQCMGGVGLTKDLPLERMFREIRGMRITEGPSEIQKMIVARNLYKGWRP